MNFNFSLLRNGDIFKIHDEYFMVLGDKKYSLSGERMSPSDLKKIRIHTDHVTVVGNLSAWIKEISNPSAGDTSSA